jgi:hypothetical protein
MEQLPGLQEVSEVKGAILTLLLVCLLVAVPATAAAYEPFKGLALETALAETKIIAKEEVAGRLAISENVAILVEGKPAGADYYFTFEDLSLYTMFDYDQPIAAGRSNRVSSRFI